MQDIIQEQTIKSSTKYTRVQKTLPYIYIPLWLVVRKDITDSEKFVYGAIGYFGETSGVRNPSYAGISDITPVGERQVKRVVKSLEAKGLLEVEHKGPNKRNRYYLCAPDHLVKNLSIDIKDQDDDTKPNTSPATKTTTTVPEPSVHSGHDKPHRGSVSTRQRDSQRTGSVHDDPQVESNTVSSTEGSTSDPTGGSKAVMGKEVNTGSHVLSAGNRKGCTVESIMDDKGAVEWYTNKCNDKTDKDAVTSYIEETKTTIRPEDLKRWNLRAYCKWTGMRWADLATFKKQFLSFLKEDLNAEHQLQPERLQAYQNTADYYSNIDDSFYTEIMNGKQY